MKSILLYVHDDTGLESRLQMALGVARTHGGHIECITCKPLTALMLSDPFGSAFMVPEALQAVEAAAAQAGTMIETRMKREEVPWSLMEGDGDPAEILAARGRMGDLIILSFDDELGPGDVTAQLLIGDVALAAPTPVLAVPVGGHPDALSGPAAIAWNGSVEAANALKAAVPLLARAAAVHIVTVVEREPDFPASDAAAYLARYGIQAEVHRIQRGAGSVAEDLRAGVAKVSAQWLVMGAYGSGRLREWLFGGVTRDMLTHSGMPILVAN